jgi:hypothetical protein
MAVYLSDDSIHKLRCICLLKRLVQIHDVTHHFCLESDRIPHALLIVPNITFREEASVAPQWPRSRRHSDAIAEGGGGREKRRKMMMSKMLDYSSSALILPQWWWIVAVIVGLMPW